MIIWPYGHCGLSQHVRGNNANVIGVDQKILSSIAALLSPESTYTTRAGKCGVTEQGEKERKRRTKNQKRVKCGIKDQQSLILGSLRVELGTIASVSHLHP